MSFRLATCLATVFLSASATLADPALVRTASLSDTGGIAPEASAVPPWRADGWLRARKPAAMTPRLRFAARCGSSKYYCNNPTPYCCGTPGNYYCARDVNGCTR